ncbi:hypothetical protein JB92DRAFT_3100462 [Gautieria morchelliformis]|nr:hypothetical protein JB92DRAFT_3100462 [Gautieria morchelliformis]
MHEDEKFASCYGYKAGMLTWSNAIWGSILRPKHMNSSSYNPLQLPETPHNFSGYSLMSQGEDRVDRCTYTNIPEGNRQYIKKYCGICWGSELECGVGGLGSARCQVADRQLASCQGGTRGVALSRDFYPLRGGGDGTLRLAGIRSFTSNICTVEFTICNFGAPWLFRDATNILRAGTFSNWRLGEFKFTF